MARRFCSLLFFTLALAATPLASAQTLTNASNSVVRFRLIAGGNVFGTIDLELFDQEKPTTVRNFLTYIQTGAYNNSFIHRCVPNFVIQGGLDRVANPPSAQPFLASGPVPNFGEIANEFAVGPRYSNVFGTISMAKRDGNPNSASSSWFINLTNNPNLDTNNGGFTVFGRVIAGLNHLNTFNTYDYGRGIEDLRTIYPNAPDKYSHLPVAYFGSTVRAPRYVDLFYVQASMLTTRDVLRPQLTITTPVASARVTTNSLRFAGTASDNLGVTHVQYTINGGPTNLATGSNNWSFVTELTPGTNRVRIESVDTWGNTSVPQERVMFFSIPATLRLQRFGNGTVTGLRDGQVLDVNRAYTVVAKPDPGYLFSGWTGTVSSASQTLRFVMQTNFSLAAVFIPNPFLPVNGTYNGLFAATNEVNPASAGAVTLAVQPTGRYAGSLQVAGRRFPLAGQFDLMGNATNIFRVGVNNWRVELMPYTTNEIGRLTGRVVTSNWVAIIDADRAMPYARTNPSPYMGTYTMAIPADTNRPTGPEGDGIGTLTVALTGLTTLTATLADGTPITRQLPLSREGRWPLYVPLAGGRGLLFGWLQFNNPHDGTFSAPLDWIKPELSPPSPIYPGGIFARSQAFGVSYVATNPPLASTNGLIAFSGSAIPSAFANTFTLAPRNRVLNTSSNRMALTLTRANGRFNGTVTVPGTNTVLRFVGTLLQPLNRGTGFFLHARRSGHVRLEENLPLLE